MGVLALTPILNPDPDLDPDPDYDPTCSRVGRRRGRVSKMPGSKRTLNPQTKASP